MEKCKDFTDIELHYLSSSILNTLDNLYNSISVIQSLGIDTRGIMEQIKVYKDINEKICSFKREEE